MDTLYGNLLLLAYTNFGTVFFFHSKVSFPPFFGRCLLFLAFFICDTPYRLVFVVVFLLFSPSFFFCRLRTGFEIGNIGIQTGPNDVFANDTGPITAISVMIMLQTGLSQVTGNVHLFVKVYQSFVGRGFFDTHAEFGIHADPLFQINS